MQEYLTADQSKRILELSPYQMLKVIEKELTIITTDLEKKEEAYRGDQIETKFLRERIVRIKFILPKLRIPKKLCSNWTPKLI